MKSESLNGVLTFVLGVLVVLGVFFALKVAFATHETRMLQNQALIANARLTAARALVADVQAYNQRYPSTEMTHLLQSLQKPAPQQ